MVFIRLQHDAMGHGHMHVVVHRVGERLAAQMTEDGRHTRDEQTASIADNIWKRRVNCKTHVGLTIFSTVQT